jgi:hypothetical protein
MSDARRQAEETPVTSRTMLPHEMMEDAELGEVASALNAVAADFIMIQYPSTRRRFLESMVRDAERLATAARALLDSEP